MHRRGFTLLELLIVMAIVAVLIGLLLSGVQKVRASAARASCQNNLKQVGMALHHYHQIHGHFPPGYVSEFSFKTPTFEFGPGWGWAAFSLPYFDQQSLYSTIDFTKPIADPANESARHTFIPSLTCPADGPMAIIPIGPRTHHGLLRFAITECATVSYSGSYGIGEPGIDGDGIFFRNSAVKFSEVIDGTSSTLLAGERAAFYSETIWAGAVAGSHFVPPVGSPMPLQIDEGCNFVLSHVAEMWFGAATPTEVNSWSSHHPGGTNYLFVDGHVQLLTSATDYELLKAIASRNGEETLPGEPR